MRQMIERGKEHRILVVEIMRECAGRHPGLPGDIDKPRIVDPLLADHRNRGAGEVFPSGIMVDQFWHNHDYIKNPARCKRGN